MMDLSDEREKSQNHSAKGLCQSIPGLIRSTPKQRMANFGALTPPRTHAHESESEEERGRAFKLAPGIATQDMDVGN